MRGACPYSSLVFSKVHTVYVKLVDNVYSKAMLNMHGIAAIEIFLIAV